MSHTALLTKDSKLNRTFNISFAEIQLKILKTSNFSVVSNRPLSLGARNNLHLHHVVQVSFGLKNDSKPRLQARPFSKSLECFIIEKNKKYTFVLLGGDSRMT